MAVPAASTFSPFGPRNVFIPGYDTNAQAKLIIEYGRNPKEFDLNKYVTVTPVTLPIGYYPKFMPSDYVRVPFTDGSDVLHVDGAPSGAYTKNYQGLRFTNIKYTLSQYWAEQVLGYQVIDFSPFDVKQMTQIMLMSQQMTRRTAYTLGVALDTNNYASNHTGTATALGGGLWTAGTLAAPYIEKTLSKVRDRILLDTSKKVKLKDLRLVINPTLASSMAASEEIRTYLAQNTGSFGVLQGKDPDAGDNWMLPNPLYGFELVIESSPIVSTLPTDNATTPDDGTPAYAMSSTKALIVARPGGLVSEAGGINFSTLHVLEQKDYAFKVFMEDLGEREQRVYIRVEDYFQTIVASPESGFVVTGCA